MSSDNTAPGFFDDPFGTIGRWFDQGAGAAGTVVDKIANYGEKFGKNVNRIADVIDATNKASEILTGKPVIGGKTDEARRQIDELETRVQTYDERMRRLQDLIDAYNKRQQSQVYGQQGVFVDDTVGAESTGGNPKGQSDDRWQIKR
jgi:Mg2+ and Co2+ transporter CorA